VSALLEKKTAPTICTFGSSGSQSIQNAEDGMTSKWTTSRRRGPPRIGSQKHVCMFYREGSSKLLQ